MVLHEKKFLAFHTIMHMYVIAVIGNKLAIIKIYKFQESAPGIETIARDKLWNILGNKWKYLIEKINYAL